MLSCRIIIIIHKTIFIVLSSTVRSHMREFSLGPLSESQSVPTWPFESQCTPNVHPSPCIILEAWGWYSVTIPWRVEGWGNLDTAVSVQPVPKAGYCGDFREKDRNLSAVRVQFWYLLPCRHVHCDLHKMILTWMFGFVSLSPYNQCVLSVLVTTFGRWLRQSDTVTAVT